MPDPVSIDLTPQQRQRLRGALIAVGTEHPRAQVTLTVDADQGRVELEAPESKRRWRIGPKGGSW